MKKHLLFKLLLTFSLALFFSVGWVNGQSQGDILITEYMADPAAVADDDGEYFELYNTTSSAIDIDGWIIKDDDSDSHTITTGNGTTVIPAYGFLVLGQGDGTYNTRDYQLPTNWYISNSGDEIVLESPGAVEICRVVFTDGDQFEPASCELNNIANHTNGITLESDYVAATDALMSDFGSPGSAGNTIGTGGADTDPPVATFDPADGATDVYITTDITITFDEAIRKIDDSEIDNTNVASLLTLKKTDATGADVAFTATIDGDKKVITISPDADLDNNQLYYLAIAPVEDENDNATTGENITFTTIDASTPYINLTSPTGGEKYYAGDTVYVTWDYANITTVDVLAYVPETDTWDVMADDSVCDGSLYFQIPVDAGYSDLYKIAIQDVDNPTTVADTSGTITVISTPTINDIQSDNDGDASNYAGDIVKTTGTVYFIDGDNYYLMDGTGAWNGIAVLDPSNAGSLTVGDNITVEAEVEESNNVTQIKNVTVLSTNTTGNTIEPTEITTGTYAEDYESVLVKIINAQISDPDLGFGEFEINDGSNALRVDDLYYLHSAVLDDDITITAIGYYSFSNYKIIPRFAEDILSATDTVGSTEYDIDQGLLEITNIPFSTTLVDFKTNIEPADSATFEVYESDGTTVAADLLTDYKLIVTAADGITEATYTITKNAALTDATVSSSVYTVDDGAETITDIPVGTDLATFESNITPPPYGSFEVYESDGTTEATDLATDYILTGTAEDGTTTKNYTITVNTVVMDEDSYVGEPTTQIPATTIAVVDGDETAEAFEVFSFDINDVGTSDAEPTNVSQMVIFYGPNFTLDLETEVDTGWFEVDGTPVDFDGEPEFGADSIAFSFVDGKISVPDGGSVNVILKLVLSPTVADGKVIQFMIDADQHGFEARTSGSNFAADFGTDIVGNDITIDVVATELNFSTEPTDVYIDVIITPAVVVEAIDANGNIDTDYTTDVSITATGATLGGSPVVVTPVAGVATFDALSFSDEGTGVTLTASSGTLTDATSITFDVTTEPETDLFFSEYIEGTSNNKAIEIYNPTGADVDLTPYVVKLASNGGDWGNTLDLTGTLVAGEVYVIANSGADQAILDIADVTSNVTYFNGNDALGLFKSDALIDAIGTQGEDAIWDVAGTANATAEHTLIRKSSVTIGNTDWTASAGTNEDDSEWIVYDQNYFDDIGTHSTTLSDEAEILDFTFGSSIDAEDAVITTADATVDITVINGTDLTALTPTITISDGATIDPESEVEQDFTNPVVYTVTAEDGTTTKDWTVTVTESATLSDKANIIEVELADVDSIKINDTDATVTIYAPYGFDVTSVKPEFTVSAGATIADTADARDFTDPQVYVVTAQDGITIKNWEVSIVKPEPMELSIYDIQYTDEASGDSPYLDEFVKTSGIVTGVGGDGFFMQASAEEWNGIYVYVPDDNTATLGDSAWVVGTVDEYQEGTQISYVKDYIVIEQGVALPDPIEITDLATTLTESHEGMLVKLIGIECTDGPSNYQEWTFADESGDQIKVDDILGYQHTFTIGAKYTITGLRQTYFGDKITPRDAEDINEAPAISGITLDPTTPSSSDDVTVSATVTDDSTDAASLSVALFYGNAEGSEDTEVTFAQVETTDEFEGTIPASDAEVFYKITASDGELTSTSTGSYSVSTSVNNPDGIVSMNVYPNPSNGEFTLEMNASKAGTFTVEIINIQGQVIYQKQFTQDGFYRESIDISEKAIGIYYIRITDGKSMRISKLMIQ